MREQEAVVMENFPDRFYNSPHMQAPPTTKLRLKDSAVRGGSDHPEPQWGDDIREIEERLRRLRESHQMKPADSEAHLKERLAKLRNEEPPKSGSVGSSSEVPPSSTDNQSRPSEGLPQQRNKTQTEEATDLVDQVSERVKLDARTDPNSQPLDDSISLLLSGMDVQISDEDPGKLLDDLRLLQAKQEKAALTDTASNDVQDIVTNAKELHMQEQDEQQEENTNNITPYPQLPDKDVEEDVVSQLEISKVLEVAQKELEQEEREQNDTEQFLSEASKHLAKLRSWESPDPEKDCEVCSKPVGGRGSEPRLDFSWGHFGGGPPGSTVNQESSSGSGDTAARQIGVMLSDEVTLEGGWGGGGDEVRGLVEKALAEAALDRRLEEKGLTHYLDKATSKSNKELGATASSSGGACATTKYTSSEWEMDSDDLPWCCICNADAQIRCYDCDDDLYCTQCFSEGHEQFGLFDHKYAPFEPLISRAV